ncbi:MAG TPA: 16S rRNA (cytosine(1402)-N(4))-methyltransferase RsmH [Dermatophilaceae bacterium]|nr:16S rRNA (cytosine(1402)-N(4))-methyltransferase RsmH [Dermatophilaceae bacterium]
MTQPEAPPADHGHRPVLVERIVRLLGPALVQPGAVHVDATVGMGGHAAAVLAAYPAVRVIGLDRDPAALAVSTTRLAGFGDRFQAVHAVFDELPQVLTRLGLTPADQLAGVLFDLGVSSPQVDLPERGFAYRYDTPLDMRMDPADSLTAAEVLNGYPVNRLEQLLREYGEERYARSIARAIVRERQAQPFTGSARLVALLHRTIPAASQRSGGHPAKRTFQALRIEVNRELAALQAGLPAAIRALRPGGRVAVLSYHSLEDRMVKRVLAAGSTSAAPPGLPVELPEHAAHLRLLTRGAEVADEQEVEVNSRATSARLRAAEKTRSTTGGSR